MRRRFAPFVVLTAVAGLGVGAAACGGSESPSGTIQGTVTIGTDQVVTVSSGASGGGSTGGATSTGGSSTGGSSTGSSGGSSTGSSGGSSTGGAAAGDAAAGKAVFTANCGACHTLADAGTSGQVGPDLDQLKPDAATVQKQVENGGGAMPAFKGTLSDADIANVAAYVSSVAGQ
jgi:mono/diheme cytochrome c family protein